MFTTNTKQLYWVFKAIGTHKHKSIDIRGILSIGRFQEHQQRRNKTGIDLRTALPTFTIEANSGELWKHVEIRVFGKLPEG